MCRVGTPGNEGGLAGVLGPIPPHSEPLRPSPCLPVSWGSSRLPSFSPGWGVLRGPPESECGAPSCVCRSEGAPRARC